MYVSARRYFWAVSAIGIFLCGYAVHIGYEVSGHAAWSLLVSSVNGSPWELVKPFALVYILWTFIELSCLRPSLLHFVCARIIMLHGFAGMGILLTAFFGNVMVLLPALLAAEYLCSCLYRARCRTELFFAPLMVSFIAFFTILLFGSVYPPPFFPFLC